MTSSEHSNIEVLGGTLIRRPTKIVTSGQFDLRYNLAPFCEKSLSKETRRAYRRVTKEFFVYFDLRQPCDIGVADVLGWRDHLIAQRKSPSTVTFKLSVVRSMFEYLKVTGFVTANPALSKFVPPPALAEDLRGRALTSKEVNYLLYGPDRSKTEGARDYAMMLFMLRTSLRVAEICSLQSSSLKWSHGRGILRYKAKGGRERSIPLPPELRNAVDDYIKLDNYRRRTLKCDGPEAYLFQPIVNYRTLVFNKGLSPTMCWHIVKKWGEFTGLGKLTPHDLRRTAITRALDLGLTYRQIQMMTGHKDPKTVMRYDHGRDNLDLNAVNFLDYGF